jgi:hypothetical protein
MEQAIDPPTPALIAEGFDYRSIVDTPTAEVRIKDPTRNMAPTAWVITLAGPEHAIRKALVMDRQRRVRAEMARTSKLPVTDPEDDEREQTELLVKATLGWRGSAVPFTPENVRALYTNPNAAWVRQQVAEAMEQRELFTRAAEPS